MILYYKVQYFLVGVLWNHTNPWNHSVSISFSFHHLIMRLSVKIISYVSWIYILLISTRLYGKCNGSQRPQISDASLSPHLFSIQPLIKFIWSRVQPFSPITQNSPHNFYLSENNKHKSRDEVIIIHDIIL